VIRAKDQVPTGYKLVWQDEFDGQELDRSKWSMPSYKEREGQVMNTPGTTRVQDGLLYLETFERDGRLHGPIIDTRGRFMPTYGYFESRIRFHRLQGHHGCFWLQTPTFGKLPDDPAKSGAEIDIIEWFGAGRRKGWAGMNIYYGGVNGKVRSPSIPRFDLMGGPVESDPSSPIGDLSDRFRIYGLLWTTNACVFTCEGVEIMRDSQAVPAIPQYIVLSLLSAQWERARLDPAKLPDAMAVDYVRVYQPSAP
jgi:beta-glucanase (GH16 family)